MNFYLLFLSLYSLCIFPLTLRVEFRLGKGLSYSLRVRLTGVRLYPWQRPSQEEQTEGLVKAKGAEEEQNLAQSLLKLDPAMIRAALSPELWQAARRSIQCKGIWIRMRVAMENAAATALTYRAVTTLMDALGCAGKGAGRIHFDGEVSFSGEAGEIAIAGIFLVRLGSLALVASRFLASYQRTRGRLKDVEQAEIEEEQHATASH